MLPTPLVVTRYIRSLDSKSRAYAYLCLDESNKVRVSGGQLYLFGLDKIDQDFSVCTQFDVLEGLLPSGAEPVVITNTQYLTGLFFDLHLFEERGEQWVLFLDNIEAGRNLQAKQQVRLNDDILQEEQLRLKK